MKAKGRIRITEELELTDPTLKIVRVSYDWVNNYVDVECYFNEGTSTFNHSRMFNYPIDATKELTSLDIIGLINADPILKVFV